MRVSGRQEDAHCAGPAGVRQGRKSCENAVAVAGRDHGASADASRQVRARQAAAGAGACGPSHSTRRSRSALALEYQRCTSAACSRATAIQPWQDRNVAAQPASPEHVSQAGSGGTVRSAGEGGDGAKRAGALPLPATSNTHEASAARSTPA
jgi:hypothetical protein